MNANPKQGARPDPLERRQSAHLREHFDTARALLIPVIGAPENLHPTRLYRAMHQLQSRYPELSSSEIEALVAAVIRSLLTPDGAHPTPG